MKKIFTLIAVAAMAFTASAQGTAVVVPVTIEAGAALLNATTIIDNDDITISTVANATCGVPDEKEPTNGIYKFGDNEFKAWFQIRVDAEPTVENPQGTPQAGSTSVVVEAKKAMTFKSFVRTGDNKTIKLFDQATAKAVEGTQVSSGTDGKNELWVNTWSIQPGKYTVSEKGGTGRVAGFEYTVSADQSGIADITVDENAPVEYFNLQGIRVANPENGLYIRRQGNKVEKILVK